MCLSRGYFVAIESQQVVSWKKVHLAQLHLEGVLLETAIDFIVSDLHNSYVGVEKRLEDNEEKFLGVSLPECLKVDGTEV